MKILAFVLAGGSGTRLHPLTAEDSKPALMFAEGYRIVDFVLSNFVNSGIGSIYVLAQYKPQSLVRHIEATWTPLLGRRKGFIRTLRPRDGGDDPWLGTADAVYRNLDLIHRHRPDLVAVFAADHVYRMDVGQMVCFHEACGADVTVAAARVPIDRAGAFGVLRTDSQGEIRSFEEKPESPSAICDDPTHAYVSMGNYLFDPDVLAGLLLAGHSRGSTDFGRDILPRLPGRQHIYAYDFARNYIPGVLGHEERTYWRDVGTLEALREARNDVLGPEPLFNLSNAQWPIHGAGASAHVAPAERYVPTERPAPVTLLGTGRPQPRPSAG
jgi:glucose-1-phosphate adenylyltransferase